MPNCEKCGTYVTHEILFGQNIGDLATTLAIEYYARKAVVAVQQGEELWSALGQLHTALYYIDTHPKNKCSLGEMEEV